MQKEDFYLFGFSFGGLAVNQYLYLNEDNKVKKVVLIGPILNPIESSLLNSKTICYANLHRAFEDENIDKKEYVLWIMKN